MTEALVVGGGLSGFAAANRLVAAGARTTVVDRGRRLGGRLAVRTLRSGPWAGHPVDLGAAYFTAAEPGFVEVAEDWLARGLAHPWTDTLAVAGPTGIIGSTTGPMRYAAAGGLRTLVEDLAARSGATVLGAVDVTAIVREETGDWRAELAPAGADDRAHLPLTARVVAICMPAPQAAQLMGEDRGMSRALAAVRYEPVLSLVAQWPARVWDDFRACFVNDDAVLTLIADDGSRRGDGAAVLVAHSTGTFAARHLAEPAAATADMVAAVRRVLDLPEPLDAEVKRWSVARPAAVPHSGANGRYLLDPNGIGVAGDAFNERPRIEAAWLSGHALGGALAQVRGDLRTTP